MAERSKALRSGRSPLLWAWVRIPLLTKMFCFAQWFWFFLVQVAYLMLKITDSRVAQWKRAGPITQRSVDRNYALLRIFCKFWRNRIQIYWSWVRSPDEMNFFARFITIVRMAEWSKAPDSRLNLTTLIGSTLENSGPRMRAWVQIPLLTKLFFFNLFQITCWLVLCGLINQCASVAQ